MTADRRMFLLALTSWVALPFAQARADKDGREDEEDEGKRKRRRRNRKSRHRRTGRRRRKNKSDREANEIHDFEEAARARKAGKIQPLEDILKSVRKTYKGEIVGVEIEKEKGVWVYEIKMVSADNRFFEVYVDAATKKIIRTWGK